MNMEGNWLVPSTMVDEFLRNIISSRTLGLDEETRKALETDITSHMAKSRNPIIEEPIKKTASPKVKK